MAWEPDKLLALALSRPSEALAAARERAGPEPVGGAGRGRAPGGWRGLQGLRRYPAGDRGVQGRAPVRAQGRRPGSRIRCLGQPGPGLGYWPGRRGVAFRSWTPCWDAAARRPRGPDPDPQGRRLPMSSAATPRRCGTPMPPSACFPARATWFWEARAAALASSGIPRRRRYRAGRPRLRPGRDAVDRMWPATGVRVRAPGTRSSRARPWRPPHRARPPRSCPDPVRSAGDLRGRPVRQQMHGAAGGWPGRGTPCARSTRRWPGSSRDHGSTTRRAELLYSSAVAAAATGDLSLAQERSAEALRLFRRQQRPWWAARAELVLLLCRFARG